MGKPDQSCLLYQNKTPPFSLSVTKGYQHHPHNCRLGTSQAPALFSLGSNPTPTVKLALKYHFTQNLFSVKG